MLIHNMVLILIYLYFSNYNTLNTSKAVPVDFTSEVPVFDQNKVHVIQTSSEIFFSSFLHTVG